MEESTTKTRLLSSALQKAREARQRMADAGEAIERLDPIEKAIKNPKSLRCAINAKCWDCMGAEADPNPRKRIRECPVGGSCPLWPVRPYQAKGDKGI